MNCQYTIPASSNNSPKSSAVMSFTAFPISSIDIFLCPGIFVYSREFLQAFWFPPLIFLIMGSRFFPFKECLLLSTVGCTICINTKHKYYVTFASLQNGYINSWRHLTSCSKGSNSYFKLLLASQNLAKTWHVNKYSTVFFHLHNSSHWQITILSKCQSLKLLYQYPHTTCYTDQVKIPRGHQDQNITIKALIANHQGLQPMLNINKTYITSPGVKVTLVTRKITTAHETRPPFSMGVERIMNTSYHVTCTSAWILTNEATNISCEILAVCGTRGGHARLLLSTCIYGTRCRRLD